jgi:hypothetical protein
MVRMDFPLDLGSGIWDLRSGICSVHNRVRLRFGGVGLQGICVNVVKNSSAVITSNNFLTSTYFCHHLWSK